jgi:hypothetical protein
MGQKHQQEISIREVKRKYAEMLTWEHDQNSINKRFDYYCLKCHRITATITKDHGVTPFMFNCHYCGTLSQSGKVDPAIEPVVEWCRPSLEHCLKLRRNINILGHYLAGGLKSRVIIK